MYSLKIHHTAVCEVSLKVRQKLKCQSLVFQNDICWYGFEGLYVECNVKVLIPTYPCSSDTAFVQFDQSVNCTLPERRVTFTLKWKLSKHTDMLIHVKAWICLQFRKWNFKKSKYFCFHAFVALNNEKFSKFFSNLEVSSSSLNFITLQNNFVFKIEHILPDLQRRQMWQEIISHKETHEDPVIYGSL